MHEIDVIRRPKYPLDWTYCTHCNSKSLKCCVFQCTTMVYSYEEALACTCLDDQARLVYRNFPAGRCLRSPWMVQGSNTFSSYVFLSWVTDANTIPQTVLRAGSSVQAASSLREPLHQCVAGIFIFRAVVMSESHLKNRLAEIN